MAKIVYEYIRDRYGITLNRKSFIKGNYSPDFKTSMLTRPHYIHNNLSFVQKEIEELANMRLNTAYVSKAYSKRLGVICHYCADFFCYAHSIYFKENMKTHIKYERRLHKYFISRLKLIKNVDFIMKKDLTINANIINNNIDQYQSDYLGSGPSYSKDLVYSLQICIETVVSLINCSYNVEKNHSIVSEVSDYKEAAGRYVIVKT